MGKNKKMNNVFKVAGAKSLKLKAKAKAVKSNLSNINIKSKDKISELDKQFVEMREKSIQQHTEKKVEKPNKSQLPDAKKKLPKIEYASPSEMQTLIDEMQL